MIWGEERTVVMYKSEALYAGQLKGFLSDLEIIKTEIKCLKESALKGTFKRKGSNRQWTAELLEERLYSIVNKQFTRDVVEFNIVAQKNNKFKISYKVDQDKVSYLKERVFGKRILFSNRKEWPSKEIIDAYHGQAGVERVFRQLKNPFHNAVRPQYHWTDQKIKVHTFCSVLSVTIANLIEKVAKDNGFDLTCNEIMDRLTEIRKVKYIYPENKKNKYDIKYELEEIEDKDIGKLFNILMST